MYTPEMSKAFKAIKAPRNFKLTIFDNPDFVTLEIEPTQLLNLTEKKKEEIVNYINTVKLTLENLGARIYIVRKALEKTEWIG